MFLRILIAAVAATVLFASTAEARHHHRHHHHRHARHIAATPATFSLFGGGGGGDLVSIARSQIGNGAVYGRSRLWCARFANWVVERAGYRGTGSDMADSFSHLRHTGPQVGAIAVMSRRGGGHVGFVSGFDGRGNPIIISGNHGRRVAETVYPASRVYAYVMP